MYCLENINPSYFELLTPLKKWKILNIKALREETEYQGSNSGLYKIISKLEKNQVIDSFINTWSNEKFIYLLPNGIKALGGNERTLNINRDLRFHDSIVSKVAREFNTYPHIEKTYLDFQTREVFPLLERIPDCLLHGKLLSPFTMAIEVELTQKSQERVKEIYRTYSDSKVVNQVLYITDKKSILNAYLKYLDSCDDFILKDKFLFLYAKDLASGKYHLEKCPVVFKGNETTLENIFNS